MEPKVTVELSLQSWNVVLMALSHRPFGEVHQVILDIQNQARPQIETTPVEPPAA